MSTWELVYEGYDPEQERLREALCTLGNGYFATRGAAPESAADGAHYPGTYVAGLFNRLESEVAGRTLEHESNPNLPNWLALDFCFEDGEWFSVDRVELLEYRQVLDVQRGVLTRHVHFRDGGREALLTQRRFVHMEEPHLAGLETTIMSLGWSGRLTVRSAIDARVENSGVERYRDLASRHLTALDSSEAAADTLLLRVQTNQSRIEVAEAIRTQFRSSNGPIEVARKTINEPGYVAHEATLDVHDGESLTIEKLVSVFSARDPAISEPGLAAAESLAHVSDFDDLLRRHVLAWDHLWRRSELLLHDSEPESRALNVHIFHLLQTLSPHTIGLDVGVPARGLHGEAYRGHIFWDELFVLPFFNFRLPAVTRSLLLYRFRRLPTARRLAQHAGFEGALYPWQSGSDGREESQQMHLNPRSGRWGPDHSHLQRHINIAVAFNVIRYADVTHDREFTRQYGLEMLIEICRFWASIATYDRALDRYEIAGVMGPDEYHEAYPSADEPGLRNNAYTNVMTAWVLLRTRELLDELAEFERVTLFERTALSLEELERWDVVSRRLRIVSHESEHGPVISQFEGYDALEELDWDRYRERYGDIQRMDRILEAEDDTPNRYKVSKQADVLMLFYLLDPEELSSLFRRLDYEWDDDLIARNTRYYLARTSNGSTLSRVVHSWVLSRIERSESWEAFRAALASDLRDVQGGTTQEGVHLGAMAGTIDLAQRCYTGLDVRGDTLWFDPLLPDGLDRIEFNMRFHEHDLEVEVLRDSVQVRSRPGNALPCKVGVRGEEPVMLESGGMYRLQRQ